MKVNIWSLFNLKIISKFIPVSDCLLCRGPVVQAVNSDYWSNECSDIACSVFNRLDLNLAPGGGLDRLEAAAKISDNKIQPPNSRLICHYCHQRLPLLRQSCRVCAMPVTGVLTDNQEQVCGQCLRHSPMFKKTITAFHYEPPISDFITSMKFNGIYYLSSLLTDYLEQQIRLSYQPENFPQGLVAVPLHPKKLRKRGFNQAQLIAKTLAKSFSIPLLSHLVKRNRDTQAQTSLDALKRQQNLRGAFNVISKPPNFVAVVDDVMTTGTTANELATQLIKQGAERVDVWCIARAYTNN
ncbi:ComF family protein [Aliikangiella coralliicola]|uniref:ComF family protein n=1 Tax=Aliikangiella coralliicola TaxID=2592383 RepID=A0A545UJT3_9GAMM|nr:ComF family protein [Aliikangiella coralliicola]TQV89714.1 ComF family protein [Aliikangiella coralliicola]